MVMTDMTDFRRNVVDMVNRGYSYTHIAEQLGSTPASVRMTVYRIRKAGGPIVRNLPVPLSADDISGLKREADRRGIAVEDLASHLIKAIVRDNSFSVALNDRR
jgi:predicted transcriptional regulator